MREHLTRQLFGAGLSADLAAADALARYLGEIRRWNRVHNLTAITEPDAMIRRHVVESLALRSHLNGRRVADIGSGAGVPGIPLAIVEAHRHFTLIESRGKRVAFLRHIQGLLGLDNVVIEHGRVEAMSEVRPFDTLLARAFAPVPELLRVTEHLFGPDTVMLALTGEQYDNRLATLGEGFDVSRADGRVTDLISGSLLIVSRKRGA